MAILNSATLKQKIQDFINRVAPFTDPLIQKSEDLEVREDVVDSVQFKQANINSISSPGTNFTADYEGIQQINVNTSASVPTSFVVTLDNVNTNEIVKLVITKKANDTFTFANGSIYPFNDVRDQLGKTSIVFTIFRIDTTYYAIANYNLTVNSALINDNSITTIKIANAAVTTAKLDNGSVVANKLAINSVTESKILDSSVSFNKLNQNNFTTAGLQVGYVSSTNGGQDEGFAYRYIEALNCVVFKGLLHNIASSSNVFLTLPSSARPTQSRYLQTIHFGVGSTNSYIRVDPNGECVTLPALTDNVTPNNASAVYVECIMYL